MGLLLPNLDPAISSIAFRWFYGVSTWLWCFFFMGLFLRFLDKRNGGLRLVADSSYWVYLIHYPVVLVLAYALYDFDLHATG